MNSFILEYLHEIFGKNILCPQVKIAFSQGQNKRLALIGDSARANVMIQTLFVA